MNLLNNDIDHVLVSAEETQQICDRLAEEIVRDYGDSQRELIFVCILKGSMVFTSDLIRRIPFECSLEFMKVSSYGASTTTSGFIQVHLDLKRDVAGANVIIVEDIVDSGITLNSLKSHLSSKGTASLRICSLLDKPSRRKVPLTVDYSCFEIPDAFVVGYGLDYAEMYRNLPDIGVLAPRIYENK
jgi:hypoxanthine phosphoribosyltransferase